jgi:hypothetical protein
LENGFILSEVPLTGLGDPETAASRGYLNRPIVLLQFVVRFKITDRLAKMVVVAASERLKIATRWF